MDGTAAIHSNLEALRRILAGLFAMAGLCHPSSPLAGEDGSARRGKAEPPAEPGEGSDSRLTLPRHLRLAILRLLRPAEAAARRLVIASARGISVSLPPLRRRAVTPATIEPQLRRFGIAVVLSPADLANTAILPRPRAKATSQASRGDGRPRVATLPLFDPPRRFRNRPANQRPVPPRAAPRILLPGLAEPHRLPAPPSPGDPVDATRLALRLAALAAALDDIPGQARRFARWRARRAQARALRAENSGAPPQGSRRPGRVSPLRPGRPPGGRLARFDPAKPRRARIREVDEILAHAHALALHALECPDTS